MCKPEARQAQPLSKVLDCDTDPTKIPEIRQKLIDKCHLPIEATDAQVLSCVKLQGEYLNELRRDPTVGRCPQNPVQTRWQQWLDKFHWK